MSYIPSEEDAKVAKETSRFLVPRLSFTKPFDLQYVNPLIEAASRSIGFRILRRARS